MGAGAVETAGPDESSQLPLDVPDPIDATPREIADVVADPRALEFPMHRVPGVVRNYILATYGEQAVRFLVQTMDGTQQFEHVAGKDAKVVVAAAPPNVRVEAAKSLLAIGLPTNPKLAAGMDEGDRRGVIALPELGLGRARVVAEQQRLGDPNNPMPTYERRTDLEYVEVDEVVARDVTSDPDASLDRQPTQPAKKPTPPIAQPTTAQKILARRRRK